MDKTIDKTKEIINSVSEIDFSVKNVKMKIFDNIIWVVILVIAFFCVIIAYLSNMSFNIQYKFDALDKDYKNILKLKNIDTKIDKNSTESFEEIDIKTHTLKDVYISSSAKSYLIGRQMLDFCSNEMIMKCIELGARFIELDLYLGSNGNIVICNGLTKGDWKLTLNTQSFQNFIKLFAKSIFDRNTYNNYKDPILLFLNINIPKNKMNSLYKIIYENIREFLPDKKYTLFKKDKNILDAKLIELLEKVVIITNGAIANTDMMKITHLRIGDKVRLISFKELYNGNEIDNINFNKKHLTIVKPDIGISSLNYNPRRAWEFGCQIVALHFQREDDFMKEYINKFRDKSYLLKPYEYTILSDLKVKGYNKNKIAYYPTLNDDLFKFNTPTTPSMKKCCKTIMDFKKYLPPLEELNLTLINILGLPFTGALNNIHIIKFNTTELFTLTYSSTNIKIVNSNSEPVLEYKYDNIHIPSITAPTSGSSNLEYNYFEIFKDINFTFHTAAKNNFINGTGTLIIEFDDNKINIKNSIKNSGDLLLEAEKLNSQPTFSSGEDWTSLNDYDWGIANNKNFNFDDKLYFYILTPTSSGPKEYRCISLHYIYSLLQNLTTITPSGTCSSEKNELYCVDAVNLKIKYLNKMSDPPTLWEYNNNEYYAEINEERIFNLDLCFSEYETAPGSKSEYKNIEYKNKKLNLNSIKNKLRIYQIEKHVDIRDIEMIEKNNISQLIYYVNRHIFDDIINKKFDIGYYNKYDLIYYILRKQLMIAYNKEKDNEMNFNYNNKCLDTSIDKCENEKMCHIKEINKKNDCETEDNNQIPFPKLCLPKSMLENNNRYGCYKFPAQVSKEKDLILSKDRRMKIHDVFTSNNRIAGNYFNLIHKIYLEIPDTFDEYCEIQFTTPLDDKTYKITYVNYDHANNNISNIIENNNNNDDIDTQFNTLIAFEKKKNLDKTIIRAAGTFVDNKLRKIEKENKLIPLKFHGYCDIKLYIGEHDELVDHICQKSKKLIGYYQYNNDTDIYKSNYEKYMSKKEFKYINKAKTYILNSNIEKDTMTTNNNIFYDENDPTCKEIIMDDLGKKKPVILNDKSSSFKSKKDLPENIVDLEEFEGFRGKIRSGKILDFSRTKKILEKKKKNLI